MSPLRGGQGRIWPEVALFAALVLAAALCAPPASAQWTVSGPLGSGGGAGGSGDVTAAASFGTDNRVVRSDGAGKGVQISPLSLDDSGNLTGIASLGLSGSGPIFSAPFKTEVSIANAPASEKSFFLNSDKGNRLATKDSAGAVQMYGLQRFASDCSSETGGVNYEICVDSDDGALFTCITGDGNCNSSGEWIAAGGGATQVWDEIQVGFGGDIFGSTDNLGSGGCGVYTGSNITMTSVNALANIANHWNMPNGTDPTTDYVTCLFWLGANIDTGQDPVVVIKIYRAAATVTHDYAMEARVACHDGDVTVADRAGLRLDAEVASAAWTQVYCRVSDAGGGTGAWNTCEIPVAAPHQYGSDRVCRFDVTRDVDDAGDDNTFILDVGAPMMFKFVRTLGL